MEVFSPKAHPQRLTPLFKKKAWQTWIRYSLALEEVTNQGRTICNTNYNVKIIRLLIEENIQVLLHHPLVQYIRHLKLWKKTVSTRKMRLRSLFPRWLEAAQKWAGCEGKWRWQGEGGQRDVWHRGLPGPLDHSKTQEPQRGSARC